MHLAKVLQQSNVAKDKEVNLTQTQLFIASKKPDHVYLGGCKQMISLHNCYGSR